jgi:hypothetical protein
VRVRHAACAQAVTHRFERHIDDLIGFPIAAESFSDLLRGGAKPLKNGGTVAGAMAGFCAIAQRHTGWQSAVERGGYSS